MIRIRQIKTELTEDTLERIIKNAAKKLSIDVCHILDIKIAKKSIDARNKSQIFYVYEVDANVKNEADILKKCKNNDICKAPDRSYRFEKTGTVELEKSPVIIGSGPCGLFCAYILAENGYNPIVIERGEAVEQRVKTVEHFWKTGELNPESNVQFGEGGAGTFSDGKLNTLVKDEGNRCRKVLETFVKHGAPEEILYDNKPHIGTDLLVSVVRNMREAIKSMGGRFLYNTCLTDVIVEDGTIKGIQINGSEIINCNVLVLAVGHSARDTFKMLYNRNLKMSPKPFAVGVRVQHKQDMINDSQYGKKYKNILSPASYKLTYKSQSGRGVYSFCMCPGGYVVNASSENKLLAINGMSNNDRNGENSNSAIIVTVTPDDFGHNPLDGVEFQRQLEREAYIAGGGKIPIQLLKDFKENIVTTSCGEISPALKGDYKFADINEILSDELAQPIKEAFEYFGRKIKGFDKGDTILAAVESRTSSPVRIERDQNGESSVKGIYPCGEGAGYAGGITSAAMDGIKIAEKIGKKYR